MKSVAVREDQRKHTGRRLRQHVWESEKSEHQDTDTEKVRM